MAGFGMSYLVAAPISAETSGTITYGTGAVCEHARRGAITYNWIEGKLAGDNITAEYIKILQDADIEVETTELDDAVAVLLSLEKIKTAATTGSTSTPAVYTMKTEIGSPVGLGFIKTMLVNGEKSYQAVWIHKVVFVRNNEESTTKEDTIAWQTPTISGKCNCVMLDASGEAQIRDYSTFETEAAAKAWLNGLANIT